jgi:broad-specificity NMP kinase
VKKKLVIVNGDMGVGKTTNCKELNKKTSEFCMA